MGCRFSSRPSLIHEGAVLRRGEGLGVIKVSEQVNVKSGSNSDLFPAPSARE